MSVRAVSWAIRAGQDCGLPAVDRLVLAVLADQAADDGWVRVPVSGLTGPTGMSGPGVVACLERLAAAGLVSVAGWDDGGAGTWVEARLAVDLVPGRAAP